MAPKEGINKTSLSLAPTNLPGELARGRAGETGSDQIVPQGSGTVVFSSLFLSPFFYGVSMVREGANL